MNNKRGQISTEYLIVVGFISFLVITVLGIALVYSSQIRERIIFYQVASFAENVISSSESVFFAGEPSQATISAYLPRNVEGVDIIGKDLVFNISTDAGLARIAYSSKVEMQGTISSNEGLKTLVIVAQTDKVTISEP